MEWANWAGNVRCNPGTIAQPRTTDEVAALLKAASDRGSRVRPLGSGHSWSALAATDEVLMDTGSLQGIVRAEEDGRVRVKGGTKLKQLNTLLWDLGLALPNLGSIAEQSIAGAVCTATHGTGICHRVLASMVRSFTLVTPDGSAIELDSERDAGLFNTAVISLGALGVVTELEIAAIPRFQLHERSGLMPFEEVCEGVLSWIHSHDHLKLWWFPHTDKVMVYRYDRTQEPVNDSRLRQRLMDEWLSVYFYRAMLRIGHWHPPLRQHINRMIGKAFLPDVNRVERSYKVFNVPEPPIHRETEWAFPMEAAPAVMREYRDMVGRQRHFINFIQEIRFVKADGYALSPCYGRDSVYVGAYQADNRDWPRLLSDFEALALGHGARPHWGKEFSCGRERLAAMYPKWGDFVSLRDRLDPHGTMVNPLTRSLFL